VTARLRESLPLSPDVLAEKDGAKFGELLRPVVEHTDDRLALVDLESEDPHLAVVRFVWMVYRMKHVKGTGQICGRCGEEVRRVWWTSKQGCWPPGRNDGASPRVRVPAGYQIGYRIAVRASPGQRKVGFGVQRDAAKCGRRSQAR
jgi:hypothetical protein